MGSTDPWDVDAQIHDYEAHGKENSALVGEVSLQVERLAHSASRESGLDQESGGNHEPELHEGDDA